MRYAQWVFAIALVMAWVWMLGRPFVLHLLNSAQRDPVGHFNRQINALGDAPRQSVSRLNSGSYGPVGGPVGVDNSRKRRLQWFLALCIAVAVSLPLAIVFRGTFIGVNLVMDVALIGFVIVAARTGAAEVERAQKVRYLSPVDTPVAETGTLYVRAAGDR